MKVCLCVREREIASERREREVAGERREREINNENGERKNESILPALEQRYSV